MVPPATLDVGVWRFREVGRERSARLSTMQSSYDFCTYYFISPSIGRRTQLLRVLSPRPARGEAIGGEGPLIRPHSASCYFCTG